MQLLGTSQEINTVPRCGAAANFFFCEVQIHHENNVSF